MAKRSRMSTTTPREMSVAPRRRAQNPLPKVNMRHSNPLRLAVAAGTALLFAACGDDKSSSADSGLNGKKLTYVTADAGEYYATVACGMQDAARGTGVVFSKQVSKTFDPSAQIPVVNGVIARKPGAMIVSATNPTAMVAPLKKAANAGIKTFTVSNSLAEGKDDFLTGRIVLDNEANGRASADALAKLLKGRKGDIALLTFTAGASAIVDGRENGFLQQIKKYPNLRLVAKQVVAGQYSDGARIANGVISAHPDLIGAVGLFQYAADGMAKALQTRDLADKITLVASDADVADVANFKGGVVKAIIADKFREQGRLAAEQAINALGGKRVAKVVQTKPVTILDSSDPNLAKYAYKPTC